MFIEKVDLLSFTGTFPATWQLLEAQYPHYAELMVPRKDVERVATALFRGEDVRGEPVCLRMSAETLVCLTGFVMFNQVDADLN